MFAWFFRNNFCISAPIKKKKKLHASTIGSFFSFSSFLPFLPNSPPNSYRVIWIIFWADHRQTRALSIWFELNRFKFFNSDQTISRNFPPNKYNKLERLNYTLVQSLYLISFRFCLSILYSYSLYWFYIDFILTFRHNDLFIRTLLINCWYNESVLFYQYLIICFDSLRG